MSVFSVQVVDFKFKDVFRFESTNLDRECLLANIYKTLNKYDTPLKLFHDDEELKDQSDLETSYFISQTRGDAHFTIRLNIDNITLPNSGSSGQHFQESLNETSLTKMNECLFCKNLCSVVDDRCFNICSKCLMTGTISSAPNQQYEHATDQNSTVDSPPTDASLLSLDQGESQSNKVADCKEDEDYGFVKISPLRDSISCAARGNRGEGNKDSHRDVPSDPCSDNCNSSFSIVESNSPSHSQCSYRGSPLSPHLETSYHDANAVATSSCHGNWRTLETESVHAQTIQCGREMIELGDSSTNRASPVVSGPAVEELFFSKPLVDWTLSSNSTKGFLNTKKVFQQSWKLEFSRGIYFSKKSMDVIAVVELVDRPDLDFITSQLAQRFLASLQCWSSFKRDETNGELSCITRIAVDAALSSMLQKSPGTCVAAKFHSTPVVFSVLVNWHLLVNGACLRPLSRVPMSTVLSVMKNSTGNFTVQYESPTRFSRREEDLHNSPEIALNGGGSGLDHAPQDVNLQQVSYNICCENEMKAKIETSELIPRELVSVSAVADDSRHPQIVCNVMPERAEEKSSDIAMPGEFTHKVNNTSKGSKYDVDWWNRMTESGVEALNRPKWQPSMNGAGVYNYSCVQPMKELFARGFYNRQQNQELLLKHDNNLEEVIRELRELN